MVEKQLKNCGSTYSNPAIAACQSSHKARKNGIAFPRQRRRGGAKVPQTKSPGLLTRGFVCCVGRLRRVLPELVVDAGADDVLGQRDGSGQGAAAAGKAAIPSGTGLVAEIDVEVFDFPRQVRREGEFDTAAGGPADLRRAAERKRVVRKLGDCRRRRRPSRRSGCGQTHSRRGRAR